jgi:hypothetical protein
MAGHDPLIPPRKPIALVDGSTEDCHRDVTTLVTRDHDLIQRWAGRRSAQPATGERTASGSSSIDVNDGDAGIRFNFPGIGKYREISWSEWFDNFEQHDLAFVYERDQAGQPLTNRYRLVKLEMLQANAPLL